MKATLVTLEGKAIETMAHLKATPCCDEEGSRQGNTVILNGEKVWIEKHYSCAYWTVYSEDCKTPLYDINPVGEFIPEIGENGEVKKDFYGERQTKRFELIAC